MGSLEENPLAVKLFENRLYMNDEANLEEASKEVLIKLNEWRYSEDNLKNIKSLAY